MISVKTVARQAGSDTLISPAIALVGPTAVGKTALSLAIARRFSCEIIGLDSMQVYRCMDIGTAKATPEERRLVSHHLIDIVAPDEDYNVARYLRDAKEAGAGIASRGRVPLFVGGTGLYLTGLERGLFKEAEPGSPAVREHLRQRLAREGREALYGELVRCDPISAKRIHPNDSQRLLRALEIFHSCGRPWSSFLGRQGQAPVLGEVLKIGLTCARELLYERINARVALMVEQGLLDETRRLLAMGYGGELQSMQAIGYRHMVNYITGRWDWETSIRLLARDTRRYAKRQFTWFGRDREIHWFNPADQQAVLALIQEYLNGEEKKTRQEKSART